MKKASIGIIALSAALALSLNACGSTTEESASTASSEPPATSASLPSEAEQGTSASAPAASESGEESESIPAAQTVDSDLAAKLTPSDAADVVSSAGSLVCTSASSVEELKAFYEAALNELGAEEATVTDVMGWTYSGTYDGGKDISIVISDLGSACSVVVEY